MYSCVFRAPNAYVFYLLRNRKLVWLGSYFGVSTEVVSTKLLATEVQVTQILGNGAQSTDGMISSGTDSGNNPVQVQGTKLVFLLLNYVSDIPIHNYS